MLLPDRSASLAHLRSSDVIAGLPRWACGSASLVSGRVLRGFGDGVVLAFGGAR